MKVISREADAPTIVGRMIVCEYCKSLLEVQESDLGKTITINAHDYLSQPKILTCTVKCPVCFENFTYRLEMS